MRVFKYKVVVSFEVKSYASDNLGHEQYQEYLQEKITNLLQDGSVGDAFDSADIGAGRFTVEEVKKIEE